MKVFLHNGNVALVSESDDVTIEVPGDSYEVSADIYNDIRSNPSSFHSKYEVVDGQVVKKENEV